MIDLWRALEIAAYGTCPEDISDVGRYVASRGPAAVVEFLGQLDSATAALRDAGVADSLRAGTSTRDGRSFGGMSDGEVDQGLVTLLLAGERYFKRLLMEPEREGRPGGVLELTDLRSAIAAAQMESGVDSHPLWEEKAGDRRRDGGLWLQVSMSTGVGVPGWNSPPWTTRGLSERFQKAATLRSLDDSWRAWRREIGAKMVDVWLEFRPPGDAHQGVVVTERGKETTLTVYYDFTRLLVPGDPVANAEVEAEAIFAAVGSALPG